MRSMAGVVFILSKQVHPEAVFSFLRMLSYFRYGKNTNYPPNYGQIWTYASNLF